MFFIVLIFHIVFNFCFDISGGELASYALSMSEGPSDVIGNALNIKNVFKMQFVNKDLHVRWSLIFQQKIGQEVKRYVIPKILESSFFSSYVLHTIRKHVLIPKIGIRDKKNTEVLFSSFKKYLNVSAPKKSLSQSSDSEWLKSALDYNKKNWKNTLRKISKNINQPVVKYIQENVVPYYFVFNRQYEKAYETIIKLDENVVPSNIGYFFNHYDYKVIIEKTKIDGSDVPIITWNVANENKCYKIFDIPHINNVQFSFWLLSLKLKTDERISYVLLFRLPIKAQELAEDDKNIKIKQIKNIVEKIKDNEGSVLHVSMGGYNDQKSVSFDGVSFDILQELQKENIHSDIDKIYVDENTISSLYNSLKQNKFIMSKDSENIYDKIRTIDGQSIYDQIYGTKIYSVHQHDHDFLNDQEEENFITLRSSTKYNFNYPLCNLFANLPIHRDNFSAVADDPFFWIHDALNGFKLSDTECIEKKHERYIKKCASYDLYSIIHNYLMCRYVPPEFYMNFPLDNNFNYNNFNYKTLRLKSSLFNDYLSSFNQNGLSKFICKQFVNNPTIALNDNLVELIKDLFNKTEWSIHKKNNFILHLCANYLQSTILTGCRSNLLVEKSDLKFSLMATTILKQKIHCLLFNIVPKIIAIEDSWGRLQLWQNPYGGLGKVFFGLVEEINSFFNLFPELHNKNVLYSDLELEDITNKFFLLIAKNKEPIDVNFDFLSLFGFLLKGCGSKTLGTLVMTKICCKLYTQSYISVVFGKHVYFQHYDRGYEKKLRYLELLINFLGKTYNVYYSQDLKYLLNYYYLICKDLEKESESVEKRWLQEKETMLFDIEERKKIKYDSMLEKINKLDEMLIRKRLWFIKKDILTRYSQKKLYKNLGLAGIVKTRRSDQNKIVQELPFLEEMSKQKKPEIQPKKLPESEGLIFLEEQLRIENDCHKKTIKKARYNSRLEKINKIDEALIKKAELEIVKELKKYKKNEKPNNFFVRQLLLLTTLCFFYDVFKDFAPFFKKYRLPFYFSFLK